MGAVRTAHVKRLRLASALLDPVVPSLWKTPEERR
jgi:hypothetical protein